MPIRVAFYVCAFFPRPTGATYSALRLARALQENGLSISFFCDDLDSSWRNGGFYEGFPVRSFALQRPGKLRKLRSLLAFTRHLRSQRRGFDLFHIHGGGHVNLFLSLWVKWIIGLPTLLKITSDGWDTPEGMRANKWGRFLSFCYRRLSAVIAMTSGQAEKCRAANIPSELAVIPNGVDCQRYHPADAEEKRRLRNEIGLPQDALILLYAGWLGASKGTDVLLRAWTELRKTHPETFLLLVGDYLSGRGEGTDPASLLTESKLPAGLWNDPSLRRVGHVADAERYFRASDIFVFPSRREGFGTVQIEAMACGLPCVVNDLQGVSADIFPDTSCGFRIEENRVEGFVAKLEALAASPDLRAKMGQAGRTRALEHFSLPSVAARYIAFYEKLLEHRR